MTALLRGSVEPVVLPERETGAARKAGSELADFVHGDEAPLTLRLENTQTGRGIETAVPAGALRLLAEALARMAEGYPVTIMPMNVQLSTQQAAELLGVSRPFFVKLLEEGRIPFRKVGSQRRVSLEALRSYMAAYQDDAVSALREMTDDAQRLGLYE
jgi:excisionase family DNA binding protein